MSIVAGGEALARSHAAGVLPYSGLVQGRGGARWVPAGTNPGPALEGGRDGRDRVCAWARCIGVSA